MRKVLSCLPFLLISTVAFAQHLNKASRSSFYTYIYRVNEPLVKALYQGKALQEKDLTLPVDSFPTLGGKIPNLPRGNYIRVAAIENRLQYRLIEFRTAYLRLLKNDKKLQFILLDQKGNEIRDASVSVNGRKIRFNSTLGYWEASIPRKEESLIRVYCQGLANFVKLTQEREVVKNYRKPYVAKAKNSQLAGYMVFSKPMYKPHDTVKFKAFLLKGKNHLPLKTEAGVRLITDEGAKALGVLKPLHPGSFDYSFKLHDSLGLALDRGYMIELFDGSQVLKRGSFWYEEYELKSSSFSFRAASQKHIRGAAQALFFSARDENDLNILDGRVQLLVLRHHLSDFNQPEMFIPDTLWKHQFKLDAVGETKLVLPENIFPDADFNYSVQATFLNANNEKKQFEQYLNYVSKPKSDWDIELRGDSLHVTHAGLSANKRMKTVNVAVLNDGMDTLYQSVSTLSLQLKANPRAAYYALTSDTITKLIDMEDYMPQIHVNMQHSADSLFAQVSNPTKVPFWYTIRKGNKVMAHGRAVDLDYKTATDNKGLATFTYSYIWADKTYSNQANVQFLDKKLQLQVKHPTVIAPGEKSSIEIDVVDAHGKAVKDVNITAYAFTSKFNFYPSGVPYVGKLFSSPPNGVIVEAEDWTSSGSKHLDWVRWRKTLGLDSMTYFKFSHPNPIFRSEIPAQHGITQIVPFLMAKGEVLPVAVLYINKQPVYFSKAEQELRYAFNVEEPFVQLQFRLKDKLVTIDSVAVHAGTRLVTSFDLDATHQPHMKVIDQLPELSIEEADLLHSYMIKVDNTYTPRFATIKSLDRLYLLTPTVTNRSRYGEGKLVGPFFSNLSYFEVKGLARQAFVAEPGYTYTFRPGLIKQRATKESYLFERSLTSLPVPGYKDQILTQEEVDSLWLSYLDLRSHTTSFFYNPPVAVKNSGSLCIKIAKEKEGVLPLIKQILLYRSDDADFLHMYAGRQTELGRLSAGTYKLILLLKGDDYVMVENLPVKAGGLNLYEVSLKKPRKKDAFSASIATLILAKSIALPNEEPLTLEKIKQNLSTSYISSYKKTISGYVYDEKDKTPLPGASVRVNGTTHATITNALGFFSLKVPERGTLQISYVGYDEQNIEIADRREHKIFLKVDDLQLSEVAVLEYERLQTGNINDLLSGNSPGVSIKQNLSASVTIMGKTSIDVGGVAGNGAEPLYIVDGIEQSNPMNRLKPEEIAEITVLKSANALAIYGSKGINGVIIIRTKKASNPALQNNEAKDVNTSMLRRNFADDAFWQPQLITDASGKVKFDVIFPDDVTNWRTFFMAMDGKQQSGYAEGNIKAFKPLTASLAVPGFAIRGDRFRPVGKMLNYGATPTMVKRRFSENGKSLLDGDILVKDVHLDTLTVVAEGADSLTLSYSLETSLQYADGEERVIPVFRSGVLEAKGVFDVLEGDTAVKHQFNATRGSVKLHFEASVLPVLLEETEHLQRYAYFCNEQMASKLKALLAQKRITEHLHEPFKQEKAIRQLIKRLQETRRDDGSWGWWKNSEGELWISRHIVEAFLDAEKGGYVTQLNKSLLINHLLYQLVRYDGLDKLEALELLQKLGAKVDYQSSIAHYETALKESKSAPSAYNQLRLLQLKKLLGLPVDLRGLLKYKHQTLLGNVYFGSAGSNHLFDNSIQLTLLAYKVLKADGEHETLLMKMRNYLLEQRTAGYWRNTYESSLILETILPDFLSAGGKLKPSTVTLTRNNQQQKITTFPFTAEVDAGAALEIQKEGDLPVYFSAYQEFWNSNPQRVDKDFTVSSWFGEKKGSMMTTLHGGEVVTMNTEVVVPANSEYVMIEIPIPAGTSYDEKTQRWWGPEVHREYGKDKVTIFCRSLKAGKHVFSVKLMPRYDGEYTLNPAKTSLMYFPVFYGREQLKKVTIGK